MRKSTKILLWINVIATLIFMVIFAKTNNHHFMQYFIFPLTLFCLLFWSSKKGGHKYSTLALSILTAFAILHMIGGTVYINGHVLYQSFLVKLNFKLPILKYDQVMHFIVSFAGALVAHDLLDHSKSAMKSKNFFSFVIFLVAISFGFINELAEFIIALITQRFEVAPYLNTGLDILFNSIGVLAGVIYLRFFVKEKS